MTDDIEGDIQLGADVPDDDPELDPVDSVTEVVAPAVDEGPLESEDDPRVEHIAPEEGN